MYIKHNFEITFRHDTHNYNTRQADQMNIPYSSTNIGSNSIMSRGVVLFYNLPNSIKNNTSISRFKRDIYNHLC